MPTISDYQYQQLAKDKDTRFIRLWPAARFEDPICVTVIDRGYLPDYWSGSTFSYEAISYAWGSDTNSEYILNDANTHLSVRHNVAEMLRHLRDDDDYRNLWIDAICINQADEEEKGKQVAMMDKIYEFADRVLIWSGETSLEYSMLLDDVAYGRAFEIHHLQGLVQSKWFSRRWVVQEVMHAREAYIICGGSTVDFRLFARLVKKSFKQQSAVEVSRISAVALANLYHLAEVSDLDDPRPSLYSNVTTVAARRSPYKSESMMGLLVRYSATECADGRDRIYALRSLSRTSIPVDYHISAEELYRQLGCIEVIRYPMALMSCAGAFGASTASWIPDWRLPMQYSPFDESLAISLRRRVFSCTTITFRDRTPQKHSSVVLAGDQLILRANLVGMVGDVHSVGFDTMNCGEGLYSCAQFFANDNSAGIPYLSLESWKDLLQILSAGYDFPTDPAIYNHYYASVLAGEIIAGPKGRDDLSYQIEAYAKTFQYRCIKNWERETWRCYPHIHLQKFIKSETALFRLRLNHIMRGRCCFFTKARQFGLGPGFIQEGDWIVSLPGCKTMMALRPVDISHNSGFLHGNTTAQDHHTMKIVGDCYVPGVIKTNSRATEDDLRTFHII